VCVCVYASRSFLVRFVIPLVAFCSQTPTHHISLSLLLVYSLRREWKQVRKTPLHANLFKSTRSKSLLLRWGICPHEWLGDKPMCVQKRAFKEIKLSSERSAIPLDVSLLWPNFSACRVMHTLVTTKEISDVLKEKSAV
jgi:hypothetical protein